MAAPGAPTITAIAPATGQLTVTFSTATGSVTTYQYSLNGGAWIARATGTNATPLVITGLTNGTAYSVKIRAMNGGTAGPESNAVSATPSVSPPGTAFGLSIIQGDTQLTASFTAVTNATSYQYSLDNGASWMARTDISGSVTATTSPIVISGLTNGTSYTVRLRALIGSNPGTQGGGLSATPSASFPTAPTITSIAPGNFRLSVKFTAPTTGITPTNYQYSTDNGFSWITRADGQTTASPLVISSGVNNGSYYTVRIRALGDLGTGNPGAASTSLTVAPTATAPGRPTITSIAPGSGSLTVTFTAPTDGSGATTYQYSLNGGNFTARADISGAITATSTTLRISTGLTNGTAYSVRILAGNGSAYGEQSEPVSATPSVSPPGPPTITSITPYNAVLSIAFTAGTGTISGYQYSLDNGATWTLRTPVSSASPLLISSGLVNGTTYPVRIRAYNGTISSPGTQSNVISATPALVVPSLTTTGVITITDGQVSVPFSGAISATNMQYSLNNGVNWTTRDPISTTSPLVIPGLTNTATYSVKIRGVNDAGPGTASSTSYLSSAPTITTITPGDGQLSIAFTAGSVGSGGSAIFNYQYTLNNGSTWTTRSPQSTASPLLITGLTNGTAYSVRLRALNGNAGFPSGEESGTPLGLLSSATFLSKDYTNGTFSLTYTLASTTSLPTLSNAYTVNVSGGAPASFAFVAPDKIVVSDLQEYTDYAFDISANNCSNTLTTATAKTLDITAPGVVTSTSCDVSSSQLTLNWSDVSGLGGSPITYYVFSDSSETVVGNALYSAAAGSGPYSYTVTSLTNRTAYSYYVRAIDAAGNVGTAVTISGTPLGPALSAPASVTVNEAANTATLTNYAVANANRYRGKLYSESGLSTQVGSDVVVSDASGIVFTDLSSSTTYYATVTAERVGDIAYENSVASNAITVVTTTLTSHVDSLLTNVVDATTFKSSLASTVASLPASTNVVASAVDIGTLVTETLAGFTLPETADMTVFLMKDGDTYTLPVDIDTTGYSYFSSAPNTSYTVAFTGGSLIFAFDASENVTIGGVAVSLGDTFVMDGQTYRYVAKGSVVVVSVPGAPTDVSGVAGDGQVVVSFTAPTSTGGADISGYMVTSSPGGVTASGSSSPITVIGLTNGTAYTFTVTATNVGGFTSPSSAASAAVTPFGIPGAPTIGVITAGDQQLSVAFTAGSTGGSEITNYMYSTNGGSSWSPRSPASTTSPIIITGLSNGTVYSVKIRAVNAAGSGTASNAVSGTPTAPITPPGGSGPVPCFFGNARVLTPSGYKRIDSLKAGDVVMTPAGSEVSIERMKVTQCAAGPNTSPYVIPAGTFGATHRLLISPDHKVCLADGRRVEAKKLGLEQESREGSLTYYNIELAGQADMVVGGVAVESLAHVRRVVMSLADFEAAIKSRYGSVSASVLANIKRTCRLVGSNAVEVPVIRR